MGPENLYIYPEKEVDRLSDVVQSLMVTNRLCDGTRRVSCLHIAANDVQGTGLDGTVILCCTLYDGN